MGELDINDSMCGFGRIQYWATNAEHTGLADTMGYNDYTGFFLDDQFHGVGRQEWTDFVYLGEYEMGKRHGHATVYFYNGDIYNTKYE